MPRKSEEKNEGGLEEGIRSTVFNNWQFLRGNFSSTGLSVFLIAIHQH